MGLTKEQAIEEHRKMWRWIAIETQKRQIPVKKEEYLKKYFPDESIIKNCFCCEYDGFSECAYCPIYWNSSLKKLMCEDKNIEGDRDNLFDMWLNTNTWKKLPNQQSKQQNCRKEK